MYLIRIYIIALDDLEIAQTHDTVDVRIDFVEQLYTVEAFGKEHFDAFLQLVGTHKPLCSVKLVDVAIELLQHLTQDNENHRYFEAQLLAGNESDGLSLVVYYLLDISKTFVALDDEFQPDVLQVFLNLRLIVQDILPQGLIGTLHRSFQQSSYHSAVGSYNCI